MASEYAKVSVTLPAPMLGFNGGVVQWAFDRGRLGGPKGLLAAVISASGAHENLPKEALAVLRAREGTLRRDITSVTPKCLQLNLELDQRVAHRRATVRRTERDRGPRRVPDVASTE